MTSEKRYKSKVASAGLRVHPYAIEDWTEMPEEAPDVHWSNTMHRVVFTHSPYTREEIKVVPRKCKCLCKDFIAFGV